MEYEISLPDLSRRSWILAIVNLLLSAGPAPPEKFCIKKRGQILLTIRQTAATGILPEYRIRCMVAQGVCPGIRSGNRFLVNVAALEEMLDAESRKQREAAQYADV